MLLMKYVNIYVSRKLIFIVFDQPLEYQVFANATDHRKWFCHAQYRGNSKIGANDGIYFGVSFKGRSLQCQIKVLSTLDECIYF